MVEEVSALKSFARAEADMHRQRKGFAKAKAELLKRELDYLRLHGSVNPRGAARRAVQICDGLASAARGYASQGAGMEPEAGTASDVTETLLRTADAFLRQEDGISGDAHFANTVRRLFVQARREFGERACQAAGADTGDGELDALEWQARAARAALDSAVAECAPATPVDVAV